VEDDLADMAGRAIGIERLIRLNPRPVTVGDLETILRDAWGDAARAAPPTTISPPRFN
jgi:hypothetical protein